MMQRQLFQKFANESPLTVMVRVMLEAIFPANQFDQILPKEARGCISGNHYSLPL